LPPRRTFEPAAGVPPPVATPSNAGSLTARPAVTLAAPAAIQRAESARVLPEEAASPQAAPTSKEPPASSAPDVDALARQVYAVLKRRLEADLRRERA
jgi:hypothetical protein